MRRTDRIMNGCGQGMLDGFGDVLDGLDKQDSEYIS